MTKHKTQPTLYSTLYEPRFIQKCLELFLAHLAEGHESLCHGAASIVSPSVHPSGVNFFF